MGAGGQLSLPWQRVKAISMEGLPGSPQQDPEKPHCAWGEWRSLQRTPEGEATEVGRETAAEVQFKKLGVISPVRCRDPVRYEKGSVGLAQKVHWQPPRALAVE